jgi:hypothetical protein
MEIMADTFTKVTNVSWFSRIQNSLKGILVGIVLFVASFPLLFWNEGRSVKTAKSLAEGAASVVSIKPDKVDAANDMKLVHLTGPANTDEILTDSEFGISTPAIKLAREVEVYQWKEDEKRETRKKLGGGEETVSTFSYTKVWSSDLIDSGRFEQQEGHANPQEKPFEDTEKMAGHVTVEAFTLSPSLVSEIGPYVSLSVTEESAGKMSEALKPRVKFHNGMYYKGEDQANPQIGDAKITFKIVKPATVSIVSKQVGNTFEPYQTKIGGTIEMLTVGTHSAEAMFEAAQKENVIITWLLRLLGLFLMYAGLNAIFKPLSVLGDVIPLVGTLVGVGTSIVAGLIAFSLSIITIGIAWFYYRPIVAIPLLAVGIGALVGLKMLSKNKAKVPVEAAKASGTA